MYNEEMYNDLLKNLIRKEEEYPRQLMASFFAGFLISAIIYCIMILMASKECFEAIAN